MHFDFGQLIIYKIDHQLTALCWKAGLCRQNIDFVQGDNVLRM